MTSPAGVPVQGLLDSSTMILPTRLTDLSVLPAEPLIPADTLAEFSVGPLVASLRRRAGSPQAHLRQPFVKPG